MDRKVKAKALHANVKVSESISVTTSTNTSSVFLQEYEKRRAEISSESSDGDYLVVFLLLQVYVENHFHYYFRVLLWDFEDETSYPDWNEKSYLTKDTKGFGRAKFSLFQEYLQYYGLPFTKNDFTIICQSVNNLNDVRNKITHGHEVSSISKSGSTTDSPLKQFLNIDALRKLEQDVLVIKHAWSRVITMTTSAEEAVNTSPFINVSQWQHSELEFTVKNDWY